MRYETTCDTCKKNFIMREQFLDLHVNFSNEIDLTNIKLTDMIRLTSVEERFEGVKLFYLYKYNIPQDSQYECDTCGKTDATRKSSILKLPPYLIITINRFVFNRQNLQLDKICSNVQVEETINFSQMFENLKNDEKAQKDYHLYGKIIHTVPLLNQKLIIFFKG